ncbi:MAG: type IX secretion system membrane protein PorP/SprF [Bacteroidetes bacterium]|nr:type IX secretion system membrane protein PorP/SprF [Bacteroidota bacterium]
MKKLILFIALVGTISMLSAQNEAVFSHYYISPILINPSVAGFYESHNMQLNVRSQWSGFPEAPVTYNLMYNGPIGKTLGVGLGVFSENIASISRQKIQLNYAFRYTVKEVKFTAGFSTEFQQMKLTNTILNDDIYDLGDLILEDALEGVNIFDASLGFYGTFKDRTFVGLSFPNLVRARLDDIGGSDDQSSFLQYFMFNIGHQFDVDNLNFTVEPSLMLRKIRNVPFQMDFNVKAGFLEEKLIAGLSYRSGVGGAMGVLLGTRIEFFNVYYSYDVSFQRFQKFNAGSHEVTVAFQFKKKAGEGDRAKRYRN